MTFENEISRFVTERRLMARNALYVVALSGGPDSVALLRVLKRLGYSIEAAHCNFRLRGEESDRDEVFCVSLCQQLGITLHRVHFDTVGYADLHKVSIEMAARNLRYHWFAQLCHDLHADGICVAHHQDDQVETVLLNMLRGTGLDGLTGMKSASSAEYGGQTLKVIRPLLAVTENDVMDYLRGLGQNYVIDSSNLKDDVQRNKLRLDIIPLLETVNPAARRNIIRMTENLQDIQTIVDRSLNDAAASAAIPLTDDKDQASLLSVPLIASFNFDKIEAYVSPQTLLWHILSPYGFNRPQVKEIASCRAENKEWQSGSHVVLLSHHRLSIIESRQWNLELNALRIPEAGIYIYNIGVGQDDGERLEIHVSLQEMTRDFKISKSALRVTLDASAVTFPLVLRPVSDGDRFSPFGMLGSKLVSDYLKDRKRNMLRRRRQMAVTDSHDNIVWLVGECIDNRFRIMPMTKEILSVEIKETP